MTNLRTINRPHATGFSLLELLVVIAIVSVLASLLIGGVSMMKTSSKESQARALLANLMGQSGQYEVKTRNPVFHINDHILKWGGGGWAKNAPGHEGDTGPINGSYDNDETELNTNYDNGETNFYYMEQANLYIERFIWAANQLPQIRDKLPSLGSSFDDADNDGFMEVVDPWGNPVAYANDVSHSDKETDDDFLPEHANPFFASAGADQKWGLARKQSEFSSANDWKDWRDFMETDAYKDSLDNLYSFDLDRSTATRGN